ncbi:MAG: CoA transferase [Gammaproteobacteria bacterium]|nr:CoA transferase [Gammaproteobacteria bacterium]
MPASTDSKSAPDSDTAAPPLAGVRILSLALNLPGPAALMRCRAMGARCVKFEPPAGEPMRQYSPHAYAAMHEGVQVETVDLKSENGRERLHRTLDDTDILLTSFRPSAMTKLGLDWPRLHARHPALSQVAIVGAPGARADEAGHDLTYLAESGLVTGTDLPPTLFADMGGALLAVEAVLTAALHLRAASSGPDSAPVSVPGRFHEVALQSAAAWLALPRTWGLTQPEGMVGGAHAGYRVYACADGRVAVAALEPHFAARLCSAAGLDEKAASAMADAETHEAMARWFLTKTRSELERLAVERDVPLHTLPLAAV